MTKRIRRLSMKQRRAKDAAFDFACFVIDQFREQQFPDTAECVKEYFEQYDAARLATQARRK